MSKLQMENIVIGEGIPKICVPVVAKNLDEVNSQAEVIADTEADLTELRIDFLEKNRDVEYILEAVGIIKDKTHKNVIVTFRTGLEGGNEEISGEDYRELLINILNKGKIDLIDVEMFIGDEIVNEIVSIAHNRNTKVIMSNHNFITTPEDGELINRLKKMEKMGADIAKIAVMPETNKDVNRLLFVTRKCSREMKIPVITMSMSELGAKSRILGEVTGSAITFGSAGKASAPGQIEVEKLKETLNKVHKNLEYYREFIEKEK